jgi:transposase-like protein
MHCIKCDNLSVTDHKLKSGRVIYKCLHCQTEFNELTNTFLSGAQISTERIIFIKQLLEAGYKKTMIAQLAAVSRQTVYHYLNRFRPDWKLLHPELCKKEIQADEIEKEDPELSRKKYMITKIEAVNKGE